MKDHSMDLWEMKDSWPVDPCDHEVFVAHLVSQLTSIGLKKTLTQGNIPSVHNKE